MKKNKKHLINIGILIIAFFIYGKIVGSSFILVAIGWIAFLYLLVKFITPIFKSPKVYNQAPSIDHGSAQWAPIEEFAKLNSPEGGSSGLVLGVPGLLRTKQGHIITVAGTGSGKGTCLIIPSLLNQPSGSYVVTDPKGENACITARSQKEYGQNVYILDPWEEEKRIGAKHGIETSGFNPFDFIKMDMDELRDSCEQIASFLVPDKPNDADPFWNDRSRTLIKTILMHIITWTPPDEHNFWTLYKMLRLAGKDWFNLLKDMEANTGADGLVSIAAQEFLGLEEAGQTMAGIRSAAQTATSIFESPQLRRSLEKSDFNPYDLTEGKSTVYIVIPERYLETHSAWLRMVIGLCLRACNSKPNKRVYYLLDEFAVMGKMKDVQKAFAFARGQNIVMWFFAQNLSQIKEIYGEDGMNTFIGNSAILQCFGGMKDQYTKEYISKALGKTTAAKRVVSTGQSTGRDSSSVSTSVSIQTYEKDLLAPDEVETDNGIFHIGEGLKVSTAKIPYFKNQYQGMKHDDRRLSNEQQKLVKAGKLPQDIWYEYYQRQADPAPRVFS